MSQFYIRIGGENRGPYSLEQLKQQPVSQSTFVWQDGMADWQKAGDVSALNAFFGKSESASIESISSSPHVNDSPYASPNVPFSQDFNSAPDTSTSSTVGATLGKFSMGIGGLAILIGVGAMVYLFVLLFNEGADAEPPESSMVVFGLAILGSMGMSLLGGVLGLIGTFLAKTGKVYGIIGMAMNLGPLVFWGCLVGVGVMV